MTTAVLQYPPELLFIICAHVYAAGLPTAKPSLDPLNIIQNAGAPTGLPSSWPADNWTEPLVRRTLANLCLVNHSWYEAAKPWLWQKIEVRLPGSWLALVDEIAGGDEEDESSDEKVALDVQQSINAATRAAIASSSVMGGCDEAAAQKLRESILETLNGPDGSIPPELLTPPVSRDPSPRRPRTKSKSPARWKIMRSISDAVQNVMERSEYGLYGPRLTAIFGLVPRIDDPRPGRFVQHLDFNHFRTIGMRRSVEEGVNKRFVTGNRVEAVLKEMPSLISFGATEYMDGSLTLPVLKELFLRGATSRGRGRPSRGRIMFDPNDPEEEDWERRRECKQLDAIDLTGCVSAVFVGALTEFVTTYLLPQDGDSSGNEDEGRREGRRSRAVRFTPDEPLTFPGLQRLGLRGVKSISPHILTPFVLAFPSLTHLDLSATRVTPELLTALGDTSTRLKSLALARCIRLTGESIRSFLIESPVVAQIEELTLYGDRTFPSPLTEDDLHEIFNHAPCFTSGTLTYLDLSSSPLTKELLSVCRPQPALRSLGLSYIPDLELHTVAEFLKEKAPNVEVVTLVSTTPELEWGRAGAGMGAPRSSARQASLALHAQFIRPLCTPPFTFSLSTSPTESKPPPTRLRVIELSIPALSGLGAGAGSWRIVRSKGGRGWYVDTASAWVGGVLRRDLPADHPHREGMERLAAANGNVSSGTGWHARKMEVLHGHGMLGREDGLYGAVSFAYQG
ncbi:hypothetical protein CONPUDRAFT_70905 [Coniophora puteana RWD-64-598 SS2]|uniref:Uncharacterized protein n=1 Tax=Coniophora puteana (strain RWD-64-598) TaxID=741705 RepID=A0A5M3MZG2_CONPW|nr:uncharacterized protein CONPUDRAFT_70905 [Coniophora puteana RWD-64-598 SS2]EIW84025.1 hypothetical protein CONPUDRAFT_70905 [Coniophora puteana RWD-64-598 SS2]